MILRIMFRLPILRVVKGVSIVTQARAHVATPSVRPSDLDVVYSPETPLDTATRRRLVPSVGGGGGYLDLKTAVAS